MYVSPALHRAVAFPKATKPAEASKAGRVVTRAAAPEDKPAAAARPTGRRSFSVATLAAVVAAASAPNAALAFGSGIPGYDINEKARDAQRKAINDELAEQRELARKEKERRRLLKEAEEAEECARNPESCPAPAES